MKFAPSQRVVFNGRTGTVVGHMPAGMVDIRFDDSSAVERRHEDRLARANPVRRNPQDDESEDRQKRPASERKVKGRQLHEVRYIPTDAVVATGTKDQRRGLGKSDRAADQLGPRSAVVFTKYDPIRASVDGRFVCGNPIDEVAYYITVSDTKQSVSHWLPKDLTHFVGKVNLLLLSAPRRRDTKVVPLGVPQSPTRAWIETVLIPAAASVGIRVWAHRQTMDYGPVRVRGGGGLRLDQIAPGLKKQRVSGQRGDPNTSISFPDGDGQREIGRNIKAGKEALVFYRYQEGQSIGRHFLENFQAFDRRSFAAPDPGIIQHRYADTISKFGYFAVALAAASGGTISPESAVLLIKSFAVKVGSPAQMSPDGNWGRPGSLAVTDDLNFVPAAGSAIWVGISKKASDPMFSWVQDSSGIRERNAKPACISADQIAEKNELSLMASALGSFGSSLKNIRSLLIDPKLATRPRLETAVYRLASGFRSVLAGLSRVETPTIDPGVARAVLETLDSAAIHPGDDNSPFNITLSSFRSDPDLAVATGLVTDAEIHHTTQRGPKNLIPYMTRRRAEFMRRKGHVIVGVDEASGVISYRFPLKATVKRDATGSFDQFMDALSNSVMNAGQFTEDPSQFTSLAEAVEAGIMHLPAGAPIVSAVQWGNGRDVNPTASMLGIVRGSLSPTDVEVLAALWGKAQDANNPQRRGAEETFFRLLGEIGQGGVNVDGIARDPIDVEALRSSGQPLSGASRFVLKISPALDREDVADLAFVLEGVLTRLYPALLSSGVPVREARRHCRDVILLAFLYVQMQGPALLGPIRSEGRDLIEDSIKHIRDRIAELSGARQLAEAGSYTTFITYNPVLFELTRRFWPDARLRTGGAGAPDAWGTLLMHSNDLKAVDEIGRYGAAMRLIKHVKLSGRDTDVPSTLLAILGPAVELPGPMVAMDRVPDPSEPGKTARAPAGVFDEFVRLSPLGASKDEANKFAVWFSTHSEQFKGGAEPAVDSAIALAKRSAKSGQGLPFLHAPALLGPEDETFQGKPENEHPYDPIHRKSWLWRYDETQGGK